MSLPAAEMTTQRSLDTLLTERYSCREFSSEPVPAEVIDEVIALAALSPSWCNTQPWHVHVTEPSTTDEWRRDLAERLAAGVASAPDIEFPTSYEGEFATRRRAAAWQLYEAVGVERGDRAASLRQTMRNFDFFGAPHVLVLTTEAVLGTYGAVDCGLFLQSLLLAARSRGLDAIPQAALALQAPFFKDKLGLPDTRQVLVGVSLGYAAPDAVANSYRTPRKDLDQARTWV